MQSDCKEKHKDAFTTGDFEDEFHHNVELLGGIWEIGKSK